jgi:hypothetical protein
VLLATPSRLLAATLLLEYVHTFDFTSYYENPISFLFARRLFERFHLKTGTRVLPIQLRWYHVSITPMLIRDTQETIGPKA